MEKGSLRCDANISIRKKGEQGAGEKGEVKNMNSFKAVKEALGFEIERQIALLNKGKPVIQETRLWDAKELKTFSMRTKEEAQDYRYFPEPDLPPFVINQDKIEEIRKTLPELPQEKLLRLVRDYGLSKYDAKVLVFLKKNADYAEACIKAYTQTDKKPVVNWLIGPLLSEANSRNCDLADLRVSAKDLVELVNLVENQQISHLSAKSVLAEMIDSKKSAGAIIQEKNLIQISDAESLNKVVEEVLKENSASVNDYKQGKSNALMFLVGQVMRKSAGRANPKMVQDILRRRLNEA